MVLLLIAGLICLSWKPSEGFVSRVPIHLGNTGRTPAVWRARGTEHFYRDSTKSELGSSSPPASAPDISSSSDGVEENTESSNEKTAQTKEKQNDLELPWSDMQKWALRDNLSKFTVQIPIKEQGKDTIQRFTLWRSMLNEVTEISGYPVPFLQSRYKDLQEADETTIVTSDVVLPYLDEYEFQVNGGLSGRVSGVLGVADDTKIRTTPVDDVHETVPKGYVRTEDGQVVYELGEPIASMEKEASPGTNMLGLTVNTASSAVKTALSGDVNPGLDTSNLVQLGALSTAVIGGAFAVQALSHHVTVNIFWV